MKNVFFTFLIIVFGVHLLSAQTTTLQLPTATSASDFTVTDSSSNVLMKVLGNGRVGIGTSNPNEPLEVASSTARAIISDGGGTTRRGLLLVGPTSLSDYARIESFFYPSTGKPLVINNSGQGKVGIWTTNPQQALHVNGTIYSSSGGFKFPDNTTQTTAAVSSQWTTSSSNIYYSTGRVAIGTSTFDGTLTVTGNDGILAGGTSGEGTALSLGSGTRLHWYPKKAAFRAGSVSGTEWDDANIGSYSAALGWNTKANGNYATAFGYENTASGPAAVAFGSNSTASGNNALATGYNCTATATASTAMGYEASASATVSTAMGYQTTASGWYSTAMGYQTTASGWYSTAMGFNTTASGTYSTAMGAHVSTNENNGSFIIGDISASTVTNSTAADQMTMRFAGGYRLFTNSAASVGVSLAPNATSWSTISDSAKKTNFKQADGEYFLSSLSKLKLGSWNYTTQDPKQFRHYGPMAQEIFHYFGYDGIGTIGNDTTLATADMDGIIMICLQALEQKVRDQMSEIRKQKEELDVQKRTIASQERRIQEIERILHNLVQDKKNLSVNLSEGREQ